MPSPRIDSVQAANKVFIAESKKIASNPTPAQKKAVATRLVNDLSHMPRSAEGKKSVLIRLGKFMKKVAYRRYLVSALEAAGLVAAAGVIQASMLYAVKRDIQTDWTKSLAIKAGNSLNPLPFGIRRTTAFDLAIVASVIQTLYGIKWSVKALKKIGVVARNDYRDARNAWNARIAQRRAE